MTTRPRILIDIQPPDLSPTQADFLWDLLNDLTTAIWNAFEPELVTIELDRYRFLNMQHAPARHADRSSEDIPWSPDDNAPAGPPTISKEPDIGS